MRIGLFLAVFHIFYLQPSISAEEDFAIPRARPLITEGKVLTDQKTLLRGGYFSTDGKDRPLPEEWVYDSLKMIGLNAIHIYGECYKDTIGERAAMIDTLVRKSGEKGIYVVLTRGGCDKNGEFEYDEVMDFWKFYGPRYADQTHVIYEIMNEPEKWKAPYNEKTLKMEKDAYVYLRKVAPDTPLLFFSYANVAGLDDILQDIAAMKPEVNWENAAIAVHGYSTSIDGQKKVLSALQDSGYAVIATEPPGLGKKISGYIKDPLKLKAVYEEHQISWLAFNNILQLTDGDFFTSKIDSVGLCWTPDFGTWPSCETTILRNAKSHSRSTLPGSLFFPFLQNKANGVYSIEGKRR